MAGDREQYLKKCTDYQSSIGSITAWESKTMAAMPDDPREMALCKLRLVAGNANISSYHLILNDMSLFILNKKNDEAIDNARKTLTKSVSLMEETVSSYLEAAFSDYEERLALIKEFNVSGRLALMRKLGLTFDLIRAAYGDNSKWRWNLVELEGRYITVVKNFLDLKSASANNDLMSPNYEPTVYYVRLVKRLLARGADMYREKYEMSSEMEYDFEKGIKYLNALRYVHSMLGEIQEAEFIKKKAATWKDKLESDKKLREN